MTDLDYIRATNRIVKVNLQPFHFTVHQYPNAIGLWPNEQQSLAFYGLIADPNYTWMEIGSFCGGSATILCLTKQYLKATNKRVISVDRNFTFKTDQVAYEWFFNNLSQFPDMSEIIPCDSLELATIYDKSPLSLVFIDGWHSFKGALLDFETVLPYLTPSAVVLFHDVAQQPWTDKFVEEQYQKALDNRVAWMEEKLPNSNGQQQDYHLDEVVSYIINEYNFQLIDNKVLDGSKNCMVGITKGDPIR